MAAPPLKNNNRSTTTTTKMFADIVQKTQTKPPFDNRNFSFPKSATKKIEFFFTNITKRSVSKQKRRENRSISSPKNRIFFFPEFASNAKNTRSGSAQQEPSRRRKRDHEELRYAVHVHKTTANHLLLNSSSSFFHFCPVILT